MGGGGGGVDAFYDLLAVYKLKEKTECRQNLIEN
jgi:hypothetical protein